MVGGHGDGQLWGSGRGAIAAQCAMVGVGEADNQLWWSGRGVTTNFGGVDVVPLLGAIAGVDVVPLQGAIVVCYGWGGRVTTNFGGVDVVPLLGANLCFISSFYVQGHQFHPDTQENNNECCFELLADVTLFSTLHW